MAFTGHSGMHTAQSMHSSGSMTSMFGPSWKQSTGQTSTQSVYLHLMQDSVTMWVIGAFLGLEARRGRARKDLHYTGGVARLPFDLARRPQAARRLNAAGRSARVGRRKAERGARARTLPPREWVDTSARTPSTTRSVR